MALKAWIGTCGWNYEHWKTGWYAGVRRKDWFRHCASAFTALEACGAFYRQQSRETYAKWAAATPEGFRFAVRGHRFITHQKRLLDPHEPLDRVREQVEGLGEKLAVMLWQVPPGTRLDMERLRTFADALNGWPTTRHALEFRHRSWFVEEVAVLLSEYRLANTISDAAKWPRWDAVTTDLVYVRLHGRPLTYFSDYEEGSLREWADKVRAWLREGRGVHVYFDNDAGGHAPYNAVRLLELLG